MPAKRSRLAPNSARHRTLLRRLLTRADEQAAAAFRARARSARRAERCFVRRDDGKPPFHSPTETLLAAMTAVASLSEAAVPDEFCETSTPAEVFGCCF